MSVSTTSIREAGLADVPLIIALAYRIWPVAYGAILSAEQLDNLLTRIYCAQNLEAEMAAGHRFWLAFDGETALGFASGYRTGETIWLKKLYVLPQSHGKGLGRALLQTVCDAFLPAAEMRLFVNGENRDAQAFYERCGFRNGGDVPVTMGDFVFTDCVFFKSLSAVRR